MHCYVCDIDLQNPYHDKPTDRYYCNPCFQPTTEEMLSNLKIGELDHQLMAEYEDELFSELEAEEDEENYYENEFEED